MGTQVTMPWNRACSAEQLHKSCRAIRARFHHPSSIGKRTIYDKSVYEDHVFVSIAGGTMHVPRESVGFILEVAAQLHSSNFPETSPVDECDGDEGGTVCDSDETEYSGDEITSFAAL